MPTNIPQTPIFNWSCKCSFWHASGVEWGSWRMLWIGPIVSICHLRETSCNIERDVNLIWKSVFTCVLKYTSTLSQLGFVIHCRRLEFEDTFFSYILCKSSIISKSCKRYITTLLFLGTYLVGVTMVSQILKEYLFPLRLTMEVVLDGLLTGLA